MTLFLRAATLLVLAGATGIAGWWTLILQDQIDGSEAELAERDDRIELLEDELFTNRERMEHLDAEVRRKAAALDLSQQELSTTRQQLATTEQDLAASELARQQTEAALRLSKVDHRTARLEVLEQSTDASGAVTTRVRFVEVDGDGEPIGPGEEVTVQGSRVYVESLVIKFSDDYVEGGDALRGTSVCLFQRLYGEDTPASAGHRLDSAGQRPHPYFDGDQTDPYYEDLWQRFWEYAHDPEAAEAKGVRALHGEAPWVEARPGARYKVELRSAGGLTITAQ